MVFAIIINSVFAILRLINLYQILRFWSSLFNTFRVQIKLTMRDIPQRKRAENLVGRLMYIRKNKGPILLP